MSTTVPKKGHRQGDTKGAHEVKKMNQSSMGGGIARRRMGEERNGGRRDSQGKYSETGKSGNCVGVGNFLGRG